MPRQKSTSPLGKLVVRSKQVKKTGLVPVYIAYYVNGKTLDKATGIDIEPSQWDSVNSKIVKHKDSAYLNGKLANIKRSIDTILEKYDGILTPEKVRRVLDGESIESSTNPKKVSFIDYVKETNESKYNNSEYGFSVYYNAKLNIEKFERFLSDKYGDSTISLAEMDTDKIREYRGLRLKDVKQVTVKKEILPLVNAVNRAIHTGLADARKFDGLDQLIKDGKTRVYTGEVKDSEIDVHYLTEEQMKAFVECYPNVKYDRTREIMDMFLFAFHACGLRVSDIVTLEWSHIDFDKRRLEKVLVKGKNFHEVYLNDSAVEILKRWKKKNYNDRFVFDLLPSDYKFPKKFNEEKDRDFKFRVQSKNRSIQTSLNEVGKKIGVDKGTTGFNLTMHIARHTFAVWSLNYRKVPIDQISRLLGHQSIAATEKNYAKWLKDTVDDDLAQAVTFKGFDPEI